VKKRKKVAVKHKFKPESLKANGIIRVPKGLPRGYKSYGIYEKGYEDVIERDFTLKNPYGENSKDYLNNLFDDLDVDNKEDVEEMVES
jgi:hypothetical protein